MSEYQYYEFQTVDRPLGDAERSELRALSSRARITATSFVNSYDFGSFRGDPAKLMRQYFDLFVYLANWGTRRFSLSLPRRLVEISDLRKSSVEHDAVTITSLPESWLSMCAAISRLKIGMTAAAGLRPWLRFGPMC